MRLNNIPYFIRAPIAEAANELQCHPPMRMDWPARSNATAEVLVSWLVAVAPNLKIFVQEVVNAPALLEAEWSRIRSGKLLKDSWMNRITQLTDLKKILLESAPKIPLKKIAIRYLTTNFPNDGLKFNGKSDYPDLYLASNDYAALLKFSRGPGKEYGAALKGKNRPVRVPDGLEVKTCRNRIAVDCHYPHPGLHLALVYEVDENGMVAVKNIAIAFLKSKDYRKSSRQTEATTVKYSFGGDRFISILS